MCEHVCHKEIEGECLDTIVFPLVKTGESYEECGNADGRRLAGESDRRLDENDFHFCPYTCAHQSQCRGKCLHLHADTVGDACKDGATIPGELSRMTVMSTMRHVRREIKLATSFVRPHVPIILSVRVDVWIYMLLKLIS